MILNKYKKTGTYPIKNFKKPIGVNRNRSGEASMVVKCEEPMNFLYNSGLENQEREQKIEEVDRAQIKV